MFSICAKTSPLKKLYKYLSTLIPFSASLMASSKTSFSFFFPYFLNEVSQASLTPGTVIESELLCGISFNPRFLKYLTLAFLGDFPDPLIV